MLKGIDPILGPELLATLRAMGHADEIAIVDANCPAAANARRLIRAEGVTATRMVQAILSVLPPAKAGVGLFGAPAPPSSPRAPPPRSPAS